jgi:hypothetical protein
MIINTDTFEFKQLLTDVAQLGGQQALIGAGLYKDTISQNKAWDIYGRGIIENLRERGLIHRTGGLNGKNSKCTYSRTEIHVALLSLQHNQGYGVKWLKEALEGMRKAS